jgi:hypothetical protein
MPTFARDPGRKIKQHVYRSGGTTLAAIGAAISTAVLLAVAILSQRGHVAAAAIAAILALMTWRTWNAGIQVEQDGVKVAPTLASRKVPWPEIDRFAVPPLGRHPYVGHVALRDGRRFGTFGLSTSSRKTEHNCLAIQRSIDNLNAALSDWHDADGEPAAR